MEITIKFSWDAEEIFNEAIERVFACIEGAAGYGVEHVDNMHPLKRHVTSITDRDGNELQKVNIDIFAENDEIFADININATTDLFRIYTSREAAELWGLSENTVTQWCNRSKKNEPGKKFMVQEYRQSGKVWLVTHAGMVRMTGRELIYG